MDRHKIKIAVYLLLVKNDGLFLIRRYNTGWQDGNYSLPAGHLDPDEKIFDAIVRETKEEIGIDIPKDNYKLVHTLHRVNSHVDFFFEVTDWEGEPQNMEPDKCDDVRWFAFDSLPVNIVPSVKFAISNYQQGVAFAEMDVEK